MDRGYGVPTCTPKGPNRHTVPFLCLVERAIEVTDTRPCAKLLEFARTHQTEVSRAFETLAYFDGMTLAAHGLAPAPFSVALMEDICPPSTVHAAYNHHAEPKQIQGFTYNRHEGGGEHHDLHQILIQWLQEQFAVIRSE